MFDGHMHSKLLPVTFKFTWLHLIHSTCRNLYPSFGITCLWNTKSQLDFRLSSFVVSLSMSCYKCLIPNLFLTVASLLGNYCFVSHLLATVYSMNPTALINSNELSIQFRMRYFNNSTGDQLLIRS